jgi:hypothetical protein
VILVLKGAPAPAGYQLFGTIKHGQTTLDVYVKP